MRDRKLEKVVAQRIRAALGAIRLEVLIILQDGICAYDLGPIYPPYRQDVPKSRLATIDHVYPKSKGGGDSPRNLVAASSYQNSRKGNLPPTGQWTPKFTHLPRDYRDVRDMVIHARRVCQGTLVTMIREGQISRSVAFDQPFTFMKLIRSVYDRVLRSGPALPECWALAKVALAHGAPGDSNGSRSESNRYGRGMAKSSDERGEKAFKRIKRRHPRRDSDAEAGDASGRRYFETA